jgi:hypothetical protein
LPGFDGDTGGCVGGSGERLREHRLAKSFRQLIAAGTAKERRSLPIRCQATPHNSDNSDETVKNLFQPTACEEASNRP